MRNLYAIALLLLSNIAFHPVSPVSPQITIPASSSASRPSTVLGQSATLLPNGQWLLLGGKAANGSVATATVVDPVRKSANTLKQGMLFARSWHSATLLPDGRVLIVGGVGSDGKVVANAEIFDPSLSTPGLTLSGLLPRAHHSATLLIDGSVLVAGGVGIDGLPLEAVERWDSQLQSASVLPAELHSGRHDHEASALPDGNVLLWGGTDAQGNPFPYADLYISEGQSFTTTTFEFPATADMNLPYLEASVPVDGATNVPGSIVVALRFSKALQVQSVNRAALQLSGPDGEVATRVVPAEGGLLGFVTPVSPLQPGTSYFLNISASVDANGLSVVQKTISFTTAGVQNAAKSESPQSSNGTVPSADVLPPLQAPPGVTALSGQALLLSGQPLANVTVSIGQKKARTDGTGRFLLPHIDDGHQVFVIEGQTANYGESSFGLFEVGTDIKAGITNVLPYKIWMTPLDTAHAISIPSPTTVDTIVSTPALPGLKLDLPAQTVIYDHYGHVVRQITITPIPLDRPPFPIPQGLNITFYFTIQPGGAYLRVAGDKYPRGARLIYPNIKNFLAESPVTFWNYDPDQKGWYVYGMGHVTPDRKEIMPDPGVSIYEFTGAMDGGSPNGPPSGPPPGGPPPPGEPVDATTGLFLYSHTDFNLPDTIPITVTRTYRQGDTTSRAFGLGTSISYDIFPVGEDQTYSYIDLVLPDGGRVHYVRTSPGTSYSNAVFLHNSTPTKFYGSTIFWDPTITTPNPAGGWRLVFKDGTSWGFPESANVTTGTRASLIFVQDRFGNTLNITRNFNNGTGDITQITSPNGRWLQFTYDNCNRIQQITDNIGRTTVYAYDSASCTGSTIGRLHTVTDPDSNITTYNYQGASPDQMTSIIDGRNITYLQNYYDSNNRVYKQQLPSGTFQFSYTTNSSGNVTQTNVTDPNGYVHQMNFSLPQTFPNGFQTGGYLASETYALGKPEQQTITYNLGTPDSNPGNFLQNVTDPLGRNTAFTYDALGNRTSVTQLSGTSGAATTSFTYEPQFSRLTSISDPLNNTTIFAYNDSSNQVVATDPLGNQWTTVENALGQVTSLKNPAGGSWTFGYSGGDVVSVADALNNITTFAYDGAGRELSVTDPLRERTTFAYDGLNDLTSVTDPLNEVTQYSYDQNRNLTTITDPKNTSNPIQFFYNNSNQVYKRTDALGNSDNYQYDANGNLACHTDRKGQVSVFAFDGLNRTTSAGYGAANCSATTFANSTTYTYDGGNRLRTAVDSLSGTVTLNYDGLDDVNYESSPQGTVNYLFDSSRRRTSMTVTGQPQITYGYDAANQLQQIKQGSSAITLNYDSVGRRSSLSLPNGLSVGYSYDAGSRLTGITYQEGATTLGQITYSYDSLGRRSAATGGYARANLPTALSSAVYNVANQISTWAGTSATYDLNGNLQSDGTNTYTWDLRNQLASISGGTTSSFQYDGLGRRTSKDINGTSTGFLYDGWNVTQELSGTTPTANLVTDLWVDAPFARTDSGGTKFFLSDGSGSTLALANTSGTVQTSYTYDPYGNTTVGGTSSTNSFQYAGRENDGTGLYFYRARYYKPGFERFLSEDPIGDYSEYAYELSSVVPFGLAGGVNRYAYAGDDPSDFIDPFGTQRQLPPPRPPAPPIRPPVPPLPPTPSPPLPQPPNPVGPPPYNPNIPPVTRPPDYGPEPPPVTNPPGYWPFPFPMPTLPTFPDPLLPIFDPCLLHPDWAWCRCPQWA